MRSREVDSAFERGTTFRVCLPAANAATSVAVKPPPVKTRRGRVLVVDDDPLVAGIVRRSLTGEHDVETVLGGRQALERLESSEFDLVICDLMMPEVNGAEVFDRATRARPELRRRFLFMTGGAFTPQAQAFLDATKVPLIDKPFTSAELRRRVAEFIT